MATDPLHPDNIIKHMADALPTHSKDDTSADLTSIYEAIALFAHACMTAAGFRLLGFEEGKKIEQECSSLAPRLSTKWNPSVFSHTFVYAHPQSSMEYVVKVDKIGTKAEIRGLGIGAEKIARFEVTVQDYVSSAALPLRIDMTEDGEENRRSLESRLQQIFMSPSRIEALALLFKREIIQKLVPGLHKSGYVEEPDSPPRRAPVQNDPATHEYEPPNPLLDPSLQPPARPYPFNDPLAARPRHPIPQGDFPPPGFDDEYDLNRPLRPMAPFPPGGSPFGIGGGDLNPPGLGPHDPLRGSFVGGGYGVGGGNGGMHPTFDDPLFGGQRQGGGYDPQAPPGSRYDPTGPGDGPRRGGPGRLPNPFTGFGSGDFI